MSLLWTWTFSILWFSSCMALNTTCDNGCSYDPILQYRPSFARSLPVQILLTGVVLTLVAVLFIHLLFTVQYHWPLAQVNYILQLSGVSTLLISLVATLHVVLEQSIRESLTWPYMLSYIAVDIPPLTSNDDNMDWTPLEQATWLVMNATTSGLIQITHIHFLTLLFPSRLEAKLIYILLGPLAILSAIMQLTPIRDIGNSPSSTDNSFVNFADAVRNVCNATLSFLFSTSLFIWGFFVNRKQAWRLDGGTAVFGAGALLLAIMSTALNVLYIPSQDQYVWLPGLMWAVVLWQSFLGWWWWVGAGMGVGEVEELLKREEKKERKRRLRKERRREQREKARMVWKGVTSAFVHRGKQGDKAESEGGGDDETVIMDDEPESDTTTATSHEAQAVLNSSTNMITPSFAGASTTTIGSSYTHVMNTRLGHFLRNWYDIIRLAHWTAAREQAVERVERIQHVYRREEIARLHGNSGAGAVRWGRRSHGVEDGEGGDESPKPTPVGRDHDAQARHHTTSQSTLEPARIQAAIAEERRQPSSMWWWGPLRRWRLQDATAYS